MAQQPPPFNPLPLSSGSFAVFPNSITNVNNPPNPEALSPLLALATKGEKVAKAVTDTNSKIKKWTPHDDLLLKESVQLYQSFDQLAKSVKFFHKFNGKEVEERWTSILFDPNVATESAKGMTALPAVNKRILWSPIEEEILKQEAQSDHFVSFHNILEKYREKFHSSRTAKSLEAHYYRMKRVGGLGDSTGTNSQSVTNPVTPTTNESATPMDSTATIEPAPKIQKVEKIEKAPVAAPPEAVSLHKMEFSTIQHQTFHESSASSKSQDKAALRQKAKEYQKLEAKTQNEIYNLERELENYVEDWNAPEKSDTGYLGIFRGKNIKYLMKKHKIIIGRNGQGEAAVDVDLSKEENSSKISRKHLKIALKSDCEFYAKNIGKKPIYINGHPLESNETVRLSNTCLIELINSKFIFQTNRFLLGEIRQQVLGEDDN